MLNPITKPKVALLLRKSSKNRNNFSSKSLIIIFSRYSDIQSRPFKGAALGIRYFCSAFEITCASVLVPVLDSDSLRRIPHHEGLMAVALALVLVLVPRLSRWQNPTYGNLRKSKENRMSRIRLL